LQTVNNKVVLSYEKTKSKNKMLKNREFLEKKMIFNHDGKVYVYFSSIPDEYKASDKQFVRIYNVAGFLTFEKMSDGKHKVVMVVQRNFNF